MNDDSRTMKVGAIASYLDHCGVGGDLHEKSVKLIDILDGLESVDIYTNNASAPCEPRPCSMCQYGPEHCGRCVKAFFIPLASQGDSTHAYRNE